MTRPVIERTIPCPQGRKVSVAVYGDPSLARPVLYFHGFPGTSAEAAIGAEAARENGVSLIGFDRPGLGGSEHDPKRTITATCSVVSAIADGLGLDRFGVLGVSGGTPYALATAWALSSRVGAVSIVSGIAPIDRPGNLGGMNGVNRTFLAFGRRYPRASRPVISLISELWRRSPMAAALWFRTLLPDGDVTLLTKPSVAKALRISLSNALSQGSAGVVHEFGLMVRPWGFSLAEVPQEVMIWHGDHDDYVPVGMAKFLHTNLRSARLEIVAGAGHFMVVERASMILAEMLGRMGGVGVSGFPPLS